MESSFTHSQIRKYSASRQRYVPIFFLISLTILLTALQEKSSKVLAGSSILYVAPSGNCGAATPCYSNLQNAVNAANVGDEIRVAAGTYSGVQNIPALNSPTFTATQIVAVTKSISLKGGYSISNWANSDPVANPTILDAQGLGRVVLFYGNISPLLEGFSITGGNATDLGGRAITTLCQPLNNPKDSGGGIFVHLSSATIRDNKIYNNIGSTIAIGGGGGITLNCSSSELSSNVISNNIGASLPNKGYGGGVLALGDGGSSPTIVSPIIRNNQIIDNIAGGDYSTGGGFHIGENIQAQVVENLIQGNIAANSFQRGEGGGGFFLNIIEHPVTLASNIIQSNTANINPSGTGNGGGVGVQWAESFTFANNIIVQNHASTEGSGIYVYALQGLTLDGHLINNTLAANSGVGEAIFVLAGDFLSGNQNVGTLYLTNMLMADHNVTIQVETRQNITIGIQADYTLWDGNGFYTSMSGPGTANIITNNDFVGIPAFVGGGDYHITSPSAAVDKGVDTGLPYDIDGDLRPTGNNYDIGADELMVTMAINYNSGAPGSYFTIHGQGLPVNSTANISINNNFLDTISTDANGQFSFILTTMNANEGAYFVKVGDNPSVTVRFVLDITEPLRPQEGTGQIIIVPKGIAFTYFTFQPSIFH